MKADQLLIEDHEILRGLLRQLQDSSVQAPDARRALLADLLFVLDVHVHIEDELFYPAIREISPLFGIAHAEHRQIDDQLAVVFRTDPSGAQFLTEVQMLADTLEHHAGEEEADMFPQAHVLGDAALEALGQRMQQRQHQLRHSTVTKLRLQAKRETLQRL